MKMYQLWAITGVVFIAPHISKPVGLTAGIIYLILSLILSDKDQ